jgi:uncharacterized FlgJ-related protein
MSRLFTIILFLAALPLAGELPKKPESPPTLLSPEERVIQVLYDSGFSTRMVKIILAQASLESGGFKSKLSRTHNNVFGMRHPSKRPTTSLGGLARAEGRNGYASYASIEDSVRDYILYYRFINAPDTTTKEYVTFLKQKRYYESDEKLYLKLVEKWIKLNEEYI